MEFADRNNELNNIIARLEDQKTILMLQYKKLKLKTKHLRLRKLGSLTLWKELRNKKESLAAEVQNTEG